MVNHQKISHIKKYSINVICLVALLSPFISSGQVIDEVIQIDTAFQTIKVIYKPITSTTYYTKKVAVFAHDTSQIAVEKSYTKNGQNGLYKVYYPSGRVKIKTVFANDKFNGEWTFYDKQGIIIIKGKYRRGIKHGYWAYKSLRIYGRYKKGNKHRKWKRFDKSKKKYLSHYWHGKLKGGEGFGNESAIILYDTTKTTITVSDSLSKGSSELIVTNNATQISKEYQQAIYFLTNNSLFRKTLKQHLSNGKLSVIRTIKKYFTRSKFHFVINKNVVALDISEYIKESADNKIVVAAIDAILKNETKNLKQTFNGEKVKEDINLYNNSTDLESDMKVTFSEIKYQLLRLNVDWMYKDEKRTFKVLLFFNSDGVLKGAEYEKGVE